MKKSKFNLSHNASLTADMGMLIPFMTLDCLPNDSFQIKLQSFVRAQPMLAPLMHMVNLYTQYWFVPYRIVWDEWTDFITGGLSGNDTPTFPTLKVTPTTSSLADYFGIPVMEKELEVSALPFRAYAEIWNTRYRDEDLQSEVAISYDSGEDTITNKDLLRPSWAKDYFTTARPFTQRGSQISVPVSNISGSNSFAYSANVSFSSYPTSFDFKYYVDNDYEESARYVTCPVVSANFSEKFLKENFSIGKSIEISYRGSYEPTHAGGNFVAHTNFEGVTITLHQPKISSLLTILPKSSGFSGTASFVISDKTLSESTPSAVVLPLNKTVSVVFNSNDSYSSVNIRDLRLSSALQRYQERSLEYGNRYEEFIQREFGIKPRDSRIQRPEYLGGGKSVLQISEVLQTAEGTNTGVGTMRGHGVSAFSTRGIRFRCPEHGVIIGLLSIRPHAVYTQGLNRFWRKFSKLDYFVPELANIGMQEVFSSELYANGANYDKIFGYTPRYSEYRSQPNRISGEFRKLLNYWNLARDFDAEPVLNSDFLTMNPSKRVFAEQTQNSFLIMLRNSVRAYRCVPKTAKNILK